MLGDAGREEKNRRERERKKKKKKYGGFILRTVYITYSQKQRYCRFKNVFFPITTQEKGMLENNKTLYIICSL